MNNELIADLPEAFADKRRARPEPQKYYSYPQTLAILEKRLGATDREIAMWLFCGSGDGGLDAYRHVYEFAEPPQVSLMTLCMSDYLSDIHPDEPAYLPMLEGIFFRREDIETFTPPNRWIGYSTLLERWSAGHLFRDAKRARSAMQNRIEQSRLADIVPGLGFSQLTSPESNSAPPAEWAMFSLADVEAIENQDFAGIDELVRESSIEFTQQGTPEKTAPPAPTLTPADTTGMVAWQAAILESWKSISEKHGTKTTARHVLAWCKTAGPKDVFGCEQPNERESVRWIDSTEGNVHTVTYARIGTVLSEWRKQGKIPARK